MWIFGEIKKKRNFEDNIKDGTTSLSSHQAIPWPDLRMKQTDIIVYCLFINYDNTNRRCFLELNLRTCL